MSDLRRSSIPKRLAAFVRRKLSKHESTMTAGQILHPAGYRHLAVHGDAKTPIRRYAIIGIAVVVVAISALLWRQKQIAATDDRPMARLVELTSHAERQIEARLTGGFAWTSLGSATRAEDSPRTRIHLDAAASEIIARAQSAPSTQTRHAAGLAYFVTGDIRKAAALLAPLATPAADARLWSDIAALRYAESRLDDDPSKLAAALGAADNAIRLEARLTEALFNRALCLESLGLREQARQAWDVYLRTDGASGWANEAREHARKLQATPVFQDVLERNYDRLVADNASANALVRQYRQDTRLWGETEILGRWAKAHQSGQYDEAKRHLQLARSFGRELARDRGDAMLQSLVAAIDRSNEQDRAQLASAHVAFREAQRLYKNNHPADAEKIYLQADALFSSANSPGALLARYFAANSAYSLGRIDESGEKLQALLLAAPGELVAFRAQVLWQVGLVHMARTRWGQSIEALTESARLFDLLDERRFAAHVREILGNAYARTGNQAEAWNQRMLALREIGRQPSSRLLTLLTSLGQSAAMKEDWDTATSLMNLALDVEGHVDDAFIGTSTLLMRARFHLRRKDRDAAARDLRDARAGLSSVSDPGYAALLKANASDIEARLATNPQAKVELLTGVIDFHRSRGRRVALPDLLLQRGRAFLEMRNVAAAQADFEEGVAELESRRETIHTPEDRWGFFTESEDLFHDAISLAMDQRDFKRAFAYTERARARALLDALGARWPTFDPAAIPDGAVLIEYALQRDEIVIFTADRSGLRATPIAVSRSTLAEAVAELRAAAMQTDRPRLRQAGALLHRLLIAPVATELIGKEKVIIIPDPVLESLPFAALVDESGRFLIERHVLVVSPSAASFAHFASAPPMPSDPQVLVVIGDEDLGRLAAFEREARAVSRLYGRVTRLSKEEATPEAFVREAASADVIHYAGHAIDSSHGPRAGYLSLKRGSGDGRLDVRRISSLRLRRAPVVVLAACGTAAGEVRSTEGTISIARAFLAAGASHVIATLWPIDDEQAAEFFPVIHRHLARGLPPAEAVRAAQLESLQRSDDPSALWAAVQAIGN